jgi:hypothetical protein
MRVQVTYGVEVDLESIAIEIISQEFLKMERLLHFKVDYWLMRWALARL